MSEIVQDELDATLSRMHGEGPSDADHSRALTRAYPDTPEYVREIIILWERDERANRGLPPLDLLLNSLSTILKAMRIAHEDREDWLVEVLQYYRQEMAARAAFALEFTEIRPAW